MNQVQFRFIEPGSICFIEPGSICFIEPGSICFIEPGSICFIEPGSICFIQPGSICFIEPGGRGVRYEFDLVTLQLFFIQIMGILTYTTSGSLLLKLYMLVCTSLKNPT